jgi:GT2 family glycosyltransferase
MYHHATREQTADHIPFGAYPTDLLRESGGWDERLFANEDFELDLRLRKAGHRLFLDPRMRIRWHSKQSIREVFEQYRRYGRGKARVAVLHPDSLAPRHLLPPALVASWAVAALSRRRGAMTMVVAPYLAACLVASAAASKGMRAREAILLPAAFISMHVGWGVGFWQGLGEVITEPSRKTRDDLVDESGNGI